MTDPQNDLRERIAEVLVTTSRAEWPYKPGMEKWDHHKHGDRPGHNYSIACALCTGDVDRLADVLATVLPPPADRAAVLREAAEVVRGVDTDPSTQEAADWLDRMAAEAQQPDNGLRCPQCGEDITDYDEDDHVFRVGDERPYCSGECVRDALLAAEAQQQPETETAAVRRARHEGAIDALRTAAEHVRIGAAVGPIPVQVRPAVDAWLCRLAEQRRDQAVKDAVAKTRQPAAADTGEEA